MGAKDSPSRANLPALDRSGFSPALAEKVDQLIEAAIKHIEWTLIWPDVVQAIRDEMVGSVPSDLAYHNPVPIPELEGCSSDTTLRVSLLAILQCMLFLT